jgi:flagellar hook-associated protein 2
LVIGLHEVLPEGAMGTVGLSFGSPTSGAGFDVSSTVASIVGNLKNVETPWNTQLTSLESQDTAISSLGTLFSKLSNDMSSLTDLEGILSEKTGSSSDTNVLTLTAADSTAVAGTHTVEVTSLATTSSGYLAPITNASDNLSGSITLQVGNGTAETIAIGAAPSSPVANTIYTGGANTLSSLAAAINSSGVGINASVLTDSSGSRLSLVSGTSGALGNIAVSSNSIADTTTPSGTLAFTSPVGGADAVLTVDGIQNLKSASNTVANLIPGVTFQLLAPSANGEQVQVVIGNDNTDVESTVNQFVTDYNSLISAMNTQDGNTSSGVPEPLFGSPTLSLLQQQLMNGVNTESPNGYLDAIKNSSDTLTGSINISLAGGIPMGYSGTVGTDAAATTGAAATTSGGTLNPIMNAGDTLSGSITIQVGSGTAKTVNMGDSTTPDTLAGLALAINTASIGVNAVVVTNSSDGSSSLSLTSGTTGSAGTLTVTSGIADPTTQTIDVPTTSGNNTLAGLASAINASHAGVMANVVTSSSGSQLVLVSYTAGSNGVLTVTPSITDATTSTALNYNNGGSDINSLTTLGISVNNDGSLTLDASSLDSVLNSDYSGFVNFFQNANSWGQTFSSMLTNSGPTAGTGILALASSSNSNIEATLNADISKENLYISAQQTSLTAELNSANEIMQQLPSQLEGVNELYSAITGYNQNSGG